MIRVTVWIERVQTDFLSTATFGTLDQAKQWIREDFRGRSKDPEFMNYGGYQVEEQVWKQLAAPQIIRTPTLEFVE
jgi:hypothetical protein